VRLALAAAFVLAIGLAAGVWLRVGTSNPPRSTPQSDPPRLHVITLTGIVTSATHRPDSTGFIRVMKAGGVSPGRVAPVGADGAFTVRVPRLPGRYALTAVLGVAAPAGVDRHSEIARATIELGAESIGNLSLTAVPGGEVRGRVVVEGGRLEDAGPFRLFMRPADPRDGWPPYMSVRPGSDGQFELRNVLWRGTVATDLSSEGPWTVAGIFAGDRDISRDAIDPVSQPRIDQVRVVIRPRVARGHDGRR
jgi:hypothetical protein